MASGIHIVLIVFVSLYWTCYGYKTVIFMHGILAGPEEADNLNTWIQEVHPGTSVTRIDAFNHLQSIEPMWTQVSMIKSVVEEVMLANPGGVHLICFSQGGLICRTLLSIIQHNVDTFISVSSPQAGQYGDSNYLKFLFPNYLKSNIYKYFYTDAGQKWSIANYWHDPYKEQLYKKYNTFLPILDNDTASDQIQEYKKNMLRLNKLVMIGGPDDGVITPWQSSHFGFYDDKDEVVPMKQQRYYIQDSFGLKTLDMRGDIHTYTITGVQHVHWIQNKTVFTNCIQPWLT